MVGGWGSGLRGVESCFGGVWGVERLGMAGGWGVGEKAWPGRAEENFGDLGLISLMPESKFYMEFSILEC